MKHIGSMLLGALVAATPAMAHHSNAMFDHTKTVKLSGTVRDFQWTNPHVWIELDVPTAQGSKHYSIEGASPSILRKKGWRYDALKTGDKIQIAIHPLKSGETGGEIMQVLVNGTVLNYDAPTTVVGGQ